MAIPASGPWKDQLRRQSGNELPRSRLRGIKQECHAREACPREGGERASMMDSLFRGNDKIEASFGEFTWNERQQEANGIGL